MRVWVLTNGYGEDRAGAAVAAELRSRRADLRVVAATLVTPGGAFSSHDVPVEVAGVAPRSGGFPAAGVRTLAADLPAVPGYFAFARRVRRRANRGDEFVAVGDVFLTGLARLAFGKPGFHVALAKSIYGRRHTRLECALLKRWARVVFARDAATAADLQSNGVRAVFVGNPLIDHLPAPACVASAPQSCSALEYGRGPFSARVLLLPGSRKEAPDNLVKLLEVALAVKERAEWACAWPESAPVERGVAAARTAGWVVEGDVVVRDGHAVTLVVGRFEPQLAAADVVVGLAGTANEQAAALGKPVVTFVGGGPQTTMARMQEQARLLGGAAEFVVGGPSAVAAAVSRLIEQPAERCRRGALGMTRLGPQGGAGRIAEAILQELAL